VTELSGDIVPNAPGIHPEFPESPMSNAIAVTDASFDHEVLKADTPVLVDFWAPWCGPCRAVAPTVEALAQEFGGRLKVVKLNTDEEQGVAIKYGVGSIPTLMVFKNGEMVERVIGNRPRAELAAMLSRHM
jgi:thioredoxin 1